MSDNKYYIHFSRGIGKDVQVYYGSDILVKNPVIMMPVRALDFGCGFYTTTNGIYDGEIFDVIYGPVANDTVFKTFIAYQNGTLSEKETLKRLKIRTLYNQLVFTNEEALKALNFLGELV